MPGVSVSSSLRHDCPPFLWSIEMSEPTNMANMFWNLDKISETTAIHSGFRLCPIISHSSIRRTIPVAFISKTPFVFQIFQDDSAWQKLVSAGFVWLCRPGGWFHLEVKYLKCERESSDGGLAEGACLCYPVAQRKDGEA